MDSENSHTPKNKMVPGWVHTQDPVTMPTGKTPNKQKKTTGKKKKSDKL